VALGRLNVAEASGKTLRVVDALGNSSVVWSHTCPHPGAGVKF